ncbi:MAG: pepsin/retropepsin-like aspartic protease family protein [Bacteroidales bacterium]|nr:pepsin/retropepsin-like aspartic protease family protein [Bacteroidales bacterium]
MNKHFHISFLCALLCFAHSVSSQSFDQNKTEYEKSEQQIITIPIQIQSEIPTTKATLNGESKTFIIDSGSPSLVLNGKYFKNEYDDISVMSNISAWGVNSSVSMNIVQIEDFDFYGIKIKENKVTTMDIAHLEQGLDTEIYGLIGYDVYKDYDMLFDYTNNTLTLIQPNVTKNYLETNYKQSKIETLPIEMWKHIPIVKGKIGKMDFNFGIDCGAEANLLDKKFLNSVKEHVLMLENDTLFGVGEAKIVESGTIKELTIGNKNFQNTLTVFNDMIPLKQLDGLIGYEILSKQKMLLSFQNRFLLFID